MLTARHVPLTRAHWFALALAALFLAVSVQYTFKAMEHRSAIVRWQSAMQEFEAGEDIYRRHLHPNSPMLLLLLKPLMLLPPVAGALAWFYLKLGLAVLAVCWVFRIVAEPDRPFPPWAMALTVLLSLRPVLGDLTHGNVNLFILFLVVAALYAYCHSWDVTAGVVLALAVACKVTPALFMPYFLWKRSWRVLAGCALGLGLFLWPGLVPGAVLGMDRYAEHLRGWTDAMIRPFLVSGVVFYSEHNNQSLPGLLLRLLTESPSFSTYVNDIYTPLEYHNLLRLDPGAVRWLVKACLGLFALVVVWACRTPTEPRGGWRLAAEFSLITLGMLLFSERTWKHHCVTLVLPFAVLCYVLAAYRPAGGRRRYLIGTLTAAALLMAATASGAGEVWERFADLAEVYGAYVWAFLALATALVTLLVSLPTSSDGRSSAERWPGRTPSPPPTPVLPPG